MRNRLLILTLFAVTLSLGSTVSAQENIYQELKPVRPHDHDATLAAFSPDHRWLVIIYPARWLVRPDARFKVGENATVILNALTMRVVKRLPPQGDVLVALAFLPSGRLGVVYNDSSARQWCNEWQPPGPGGSNWTLSGQHILFEPNAQPLGEAHPDTRERPSEYGAFSADATQFVTHYGHIEGESIPPRRFVGRTVIWDSVTWTPRASWKRNPGADSKILAFTADNRILADSPREFGARTDDVRYNNTEYITKLMQPFYWLGAVPRLRSTLDLWGPQPAVSMSPDGRWWVASVVDNVAGSLLRYDVNGGNNLVPPAEALDANPRTSMDPYYSAVTFSPDGRFVAAGKVDGQMVVWETDHWTVVAAFPPTRVEICCLAFTRDDQTLIGGCEDGSIRIWKRTSIGTARSTVCRNSQGSRNRQGSSHSHTGCRCRS